MYEYSKYGLDESVFPRSGIAGVYGDSMSNFWETVECLNMFSCAFWAFVIFDEMSVHIIHPFLIGCLSNCWAVEIL